MIRSVAHISRIVLFISALYVVLLIDYLSVFDLQKLGVYPRVFIGLRGVLFSPFLHGGLAHLVSNTVPLLVLMGLTYIFYQRIAFKVTLLIWLLSGILLWCFGRQVIHIGASGLVYGFAAFLVTKGFVDRNFKSLIIAVVVISIYGGITYGLLPIRSGVSFEGHIFGALSGVYAGKRYRNKVG